MGKLKTYDQFVNENLKAVVGSPVKYIKIKNNLKKYQKAKVKQALNDVDFAKRKNKGAEKMTAGQKEVLKQANIAKNAALADTTSAITQRMKDIATTEPLKKVVSLGTTKARLAANQVAFKSADGEEKKKLKIKANELQKKAADLTGELKDYESTDSKEEPKAKASTQNTDDIKTDPPKDDTKVDANKKAIEDAQKEVDKAKAAYDAVKDGDDEKGKLQAEIKFKQAQQKKAKAEGNSELVQGLGDDIGEVMKKIQDLDKTPNDPGAKLEADIKAFNDNIEAERATMNKAVKDLDQAKRDLKTGRGSEEQVQKLQKAIEDSKEDIAELKKKEADAKKKLATLSKPKGESFEYVAESVSQKFTRLRNEM